MWQAPNQRVRAAASAKKRERDRNQRPIHLKRVHADLQSIGESTSLPSVASEVRLVLNDLTEAGFTFFSRKRLHAGQEVVLTLKDPRPLELKGKIVWCQEHEADGHVLSPEPFSFRAGLQLAFSSEEERAAFKAFCDELAESSITLASAA